MGGDRSLRLGLGRRKRGISGYGTGAEHNCRGGGGTGLSASPSKSYDSPGGSESGRREKADYRGRSRLEAGFGGLGGSRDSGPSGIALALDMQEHGEPRRGTAPSRPPRDRP